MIIFHIELIDKKDLSKESNRIVTERWPSGNSLHTKEKKTKIFHIQPAHSQH
jgi:hypothetical protein